MESIQTKSRTTSVWQRGIKTDGGVNVTTMVCHTLVYGMVAWRERERERGREGGREEGRRDRQEEVREEGRKGGREEGRKNGCSCKKEQQKQ